MLNPTSFPSFLHLLAARSLALFATAKVTNRDFPSYFRVLHPDFCHFKYRAAGEFSFGGEMLKPVFHWVSAFVAIL